MQMFPLFIKFLHKKLLMLLPVTSLAKRGLQVSMGIPCPAGLTTHYCHYWTGHCLHIYYVYITEVDHCILLLQVTRPARCGLGGAPGPPAASPAAVTGCGADTGAVCEDISLSLSAYCAGSAPGTPTVAAPTWTRQRAATPPTATLPRPTR